MAHITLSIGLCEAKRLVRYWGTVIESLDAFEKRRSLFATKIQLAQVPRARPIPIQTFPIPKAIILPGKPISNHPLISEDCALIAVTHGPIERPPRK